MAVSGGSLTLMLGLSATAGYAVSNPQVSENFGADIAHTNTRLSNTEEESMLKRVNDARVEHCLPILRESEALSTVARGWSAQMAGQGQDIDHNPETGAQLPAGWSVAGENIAAGQPTVKMMMEWWLDQPDPDTNILHEDFTDIGVSFEKGLGGYYPTYGTQVFAGYADSQGGTFLDVRPWHQFYTEIQWMADEGLSSGVAAEGCEHEVMYKPKAQVSREAIAAFMYRQHAPTDYQAPAQSPFRDVQPGDGFYTEIAWMYDSGLSTGVDTGDGATEYRPKARMSREAMAAFMYRAAEPADYTAPETSAFRDMRPSADFYEEISWMYDEGLTTGIEVDNGALEYRPKSKVSREAMAAFMHRASEIHV